MTRKQHRREKRARLQAKKSPDLGLEKPLDADPEQVALEFQNWRRSFLNEFARHKNMEAAAA